MEKDNYSWIKKNKILFGILMGLSCILAIVVIMIAFSKEEIVFNVADGETIRLEYGKDLQLPKVTAQCRGTVFHAKGTDLDVTTTGAVDFSQIGNYTLTYSASHQNMEESITISVDVVDTQPPVITLVASPEHYTSPVGKYEEEGFQALDNYDGDITSQVVSAEVDGVVIYTVADSSGNQAEVHREIIYKDVIAPIMQLSGNKSMTITLGESFEEPGFQATDECDGDITKNVQIEGQVDTQKAGSYTLTYKVADSSGNVCELKRTVKVKEPVTVIPGEKVVYLTFDDGPGPYTQRLLDILDKYNVKVTFFVTGMKPAYFDLIGEAHRRGHTIALHTYSHVYSDIYSSVDAYYRDLEKIRNVVIEQTGEEPTLVRFPGGTSNATSKKYCEGIMTTLSNDLGNHGYQYCDWNVASGDAGGADSEQEVFQNVKNGIAGKKHSIVLQHDIKSFSVDAVDDIIEWALANGYTFKAMDEDTKMTQHNPLN